MYGCGGCYRSMKYERVLMDIYSRLYESFGPQYWWPGESRLEIIIGAILTQAVNWRNVEMAIDNLKQEGKLSITALKGIQEKKLARLIKPSGYYNMKARKIKAFIHYLDLYYQGKLKNMFQEKPEKLRESLLEVYGIGPETADSILLYAGQLPFFVVDAYTRRIFSRSGLINKNDAYEKIRSFVESRLPREVKLYNEYHALLVRLGKEHCFRQEPDCAGCPLNREKE